MKKLLILFVLLGSICFAQLGGAKIVAPELTFNFGEIAQNIFVEHDFVISNAGYDTLIIKDVHASCGCTAATPAKNVLKPGEATKINVKFNTIARQGHQQKYVYIISNDKENPEIRLGFTAEVKAEKPAVSTANAPKLELAETQHDFGDMKEGQIADWTLNFKNAGTGTLEIKDVKTSCGCTAAVVSGKTIKPGEKGTVRIEFDSTNKSGKLTRTVTLSTNDPKMPEQTIVINANVNGR